VLCARGIRTAIVEILATQVLLQAAESSFVIRPLIRGVGAVVEVPAVSILV